MWYPVVFVCLFLCYNEIKSWPQDRKAVVITKYAKVARWGAQDNDTEIQSTDQKHNNIQNHRIEGQPPKLTLYQPRRMNNNVAYQYPVYRRIDNEADPINVPAVGEVSVFGSEVESSKKHADAVYGPPKLDTKSTALRSSSNDKPNDLYLSPFDSYNPPQSSIKSANNAAVLYPPLAQNTYGPPPVPSQVYKTSVSSSKSIESTLGPPLAQVNSYHSDSIDAPPSDHADDYMDHNAPPAIEEDAPPNHDGTPKHASSYNDGPPDFPPKSIDDIYDPSEINGMQQPAPEIHGPPNGYYPAPGYSPGPDAMVDQQIQGPPNSDMTLDLYPPAEAVHVHHDHYPKFLYDDPHYDHHVYEEIHHTTTTQAPRKKHYSYYFLGRKLWFIPLYFSMYFIVYVAILILKAVLRRKIDYKYDWITSHSRDAKQMTFDKIKTIDDMHKNVTKAIDKVAHMYSNIAM